MRLLLILFLASSAGAAPLSDEQRQGRELYRRGTAKYALRNYEGAIVDFKSAYELTREPGLLFDLAQASRLAHHPDDALHFYRTYLRQKPEAPNRGDVEELIADLEKSEKSQPVASLTAVPPRAASPETQEIRSPREAPPPERREARRHLPPPTLPKSRGVSQRLELGIGVSLLAGAVGLFGGAIALGVASTHDADAISNAARHGGAWSPSLTSQWEQGQRMAAASTALYVIGGAAAVAGVTLTVLGARGRIWFAPAVRGGQVAWASEF